MVGGRRVLISDLKQGVIMKQVMSYKLSFSESIERIEDDVLGNIMRWNGWAGLWRWMLCKGCNSFYG